MSADGLSAKCPVCTLDASLAGVYAGAPVITCEGCAFPLGGRCGKCKTFYRAGRYAGYEMNEVTMIFVDKGQQPLRETPCKAHYVVQHAAAADESLDVIMLD